MVVPRERLGAAERKAQILRCATSVFARSSYRVAGMADVAREAGISEPTIYKYFPSKKQLFLEILAKVGELTLRSWQEAAEHELDAAALLRRIGARQFEATLKSPELLKVQFQALSEVDDAEIRQLLCDNFSSYVEFLGSIVERGQRAGRIAPSLSPAVLAWNLLAIGFTLNLTGLLGLSESLSFEMVDAMGGLVLRAASAG